jgi:hypothetical protein
MILESLQNISIDPAKGSSHQLPNRPIGFSEMTQNTTEIQILTSLTIKWYL